MTAGPGKRPRRACICAASAWFHPSPVAATWDFTVFAGGAARRGRAYVCVPRDNLPGFVDRLEEGALDAAIAGYLALVRPAAGSVGATDRPGAWTFTTGWYSHGLLAPEHDPQNRPLRVRTAMGKSTRPHALGKRHRRRRLPRSSIRPRFARQGG